MTPARSGFDMPAPLNLPALLADFRRASGRRIFLDYDGTLVDFAARPEDAVPSVEVLRALERLAQAGGNLVTVISGRGRPDLERWFGEIRGLWIAAEHGAFVRPAGGPWRESEPVPAAWKERVRPVLREAVTITPESFIEEKEHCLVWHFRNAGEDLAEARAKVLLVRLNEMLAGSALVAIPGRKIVEIKPARSDKGSVVQRVIRDCGSAGFWLAAGDDRTDEDLFAAMPPGSWTIHIGAGPSRARYAVAGVVQMNSLLASMSANINTFT